MARLGLLFLLFLMQYLAMAQPGPQTIYLHFKLYDNNGHKVTPADKDYQVLVELFDPSKDGYSVKPARYDYRYNKFSYMLTGQYDSTYYATIKDFYYNFDGESDRWNIKYLIIKGVDTMVIYGPAFEMDHILFRKGQYYVPQYIERYKQYYQRYLDIELANDYNSWNCDWELLKHPNTIYVEKVADAKPDTAAVAIRERRDLSQRWFTVNDDAENGIAYSLGYMWEGSKTLVIAKQKGKYVLYALNEAVDSAIGTGHWQKPVFLIDTAVFQNGNYYGFARTVHWTGSFRFETTGWYKLHVGLKKLDPGYDCLRLKYFHDRYEEFEEFYLEWRKKEPEYDYVKENMKESRKELKALGMQYWARPCD